MQITLQRLPLNLVGQTWEVFSAEDLRTAGLPVSMIDFIMQIQPGALRVTAWGKTRITSLPRLKINKSMDEAIPMLMLEWDEERISGFAPLTGPSYRLSPLPGLPAASFVWETSRFQVFGWTIWSGKPCLIAYGHGDHPGPPAYIIPNPRRKLLQ